MLAGLVTVAVTLLAAAPVGLAWAALAPRADAVLVGGVYVQADPASAAFIADDGTLFLSFVLAGVVTGLLAFRLGRAHGPAVVSALAVGGLAAAHLAGRVGETVGLRALQEAARAGVTRGQLTLEIGADVVVAGWPAAALLAYLAAMLVRRRGRSVQADGPARQLG